MATAADAWNAYFYPGTNTLRNIPGITNPEELREFEYATTGQRRNEIIQNPALIDHTWDASHVRAIHAYLFQDIYPWAGQYRTVNMFKAPSPRGFANVHTGEIDRYLTDTHRLVTTTDWSNLDHQDFAAAAANVFAHLNQAHPFREGNGRTSKVFMAHVAGLSPLGVKGWKQRGGVRRLLVG